MGSVEEKEARFRAMLAENGDRIYRICCCYVRGYDAREDAYQTTLMHIWESLDTFKGMSQISTWIFRITVNTCLGYLRSQKRSQMALEQAARDLDHTGEATTTQRVETEDLRPDVERLYRCIHQLKPLEQTLVSLYLEDASTEQIAEVLGISPVNARVKLHRIKKALKELWEKDNHES